jgi:hypothetical protein
MNNLHVAGVNIGDTFSSRDEVKEAGLHRHGSIGGAGISYCSESGLAEAIVLSGGYEDDEDFGDWSITQDKVAEETTADKMRIRSLPEATKHSGSHVIHISLCELSEVTRPNHDGALGMGIGTMACTT